MKPTPVLKLRLISGLTQQKMAEIVKEDRASISRYETGKTEITLSKFLRWCKVLKIYDFDMMFF